MEQETFYKDQYDRTLDRKNEINSSLSTPIGILTALVAGLLYATSNFDYTGHLGLTMLFAIISLFSCYLLTRSIYHLVKALSDLHQGYDYAYLPDTKVLDGYYQGLLSFYDAQPNTTPTQAKKHAQDDFDSYLQGLWIDGADINQKNNKAKMFQRFKCHQFMIFAFISLSLLIIPFGIDFGINKGKEKVQQVKIVNSPLVIKDTLDHGKATRIKTDTAAHSNDPRRCKPQHATPGKQRDKKVSRKG